MWCCNSMHAVCDYASGATYRECPNIEQIRNGVIPLDSLPAAWWNWMWWDTNKAVNEARSAVGMFLNEMETVLCAAGVTACCTCVDNLYSAIEKIRTTVGTSLIAGAVKSSSCGGQVTIENDGTMTMNGVGNAANLTTTSKQVVGAINELKSTYDNCWTNNTTALSGKAPNAHASSETTYGVGNADCYGHLKISDTYDQVLSTCAGVAASQKALACVYSAMTGAGYATLGSTAGCALGTAAAGTANTAARSDHVHPAQAWVECAGCVSRQGVSCSYDEKVLFGASDGPVGYSDACCFTFNPATGVLQANYFKGYACCAMQLRANAANTDVCIYACNATSAVAVAKACSDGTLLQRQIYCNQTLWYKIPFTMAGAAAGTAGCVTGTLEKLGIATAACHLAYNPGTCTLCVPKISGNTFSGCAACAGKDGSGCSFGTAARYACGCFLSATGCAADSAKLTGKAPSALCVACAYCANFADLSTCAVYGYSLRQTSVTAIKNRLQLCSALFCGEEKCCSGYLSCSYFVCFKLPTLVIDCVSSPNTVCYHEAGYVYSWNMGPNCSIDYGRNCFDICCMPRIRFL